MKEVNYKYAVLDILEQYRADEDREYLHKRFMALNNKVRRLNRTTKKNLSVKFFEDDTSITDITSIGRMLDVQFNPIGNIEYIEDCINIALTTGELISYFS